MKRNFILDEEINLLDGNDLLNTRVYAKNLRSAIDNVPKNKSFTIGLFGEWGSGKSSIIKTVREELEDPKNTKIKFVLYDAWKYSNDSFRRMFLLELQNALNFERDTLMAPFYSNSSEDAQVKMKLNTKKLLIMVLILFLLFIIVNISGLSTELKIGLSTFIPLAGLFMTISTRIFDEIKVTIQKPHLFAPEQFEDCFKEMVEKSLKQYNWMEKAFCYVNGENYTKDIEKLIIVIDNIDRCHKEMAYELLTNIKNFLGSTHNIIFIIPVDDSALRKHIVSNSKSNDSCEYEAEEFLRKFFNATIRIKPYHSDEMFEFAEKINQKHNLKFSPDTIDIVSKEYARNPRRIIQFFNNLSLELVSFSDSFVQKHESLICKLLIIREEYPDFYKKISLNSHLLHNTGEEINKDFKHYPELRGFLDSTRVISQNISTERLEKILSNSSVFSGITQDLLTSINNLEVDSISQFIGDDPIKKNTVIKYIIEQMKKGISRNTFDTEVIPKFNLMTLINEKFPLEKSENHRILEVINDKLSIIFEKCDLTSAVNYCNSTFIQKLPNMTEYIVEWVRNGILNEKEPSNRLNEAFTNICQRYSDSAILLSLTEPFEKFYSNNYNTIELEKIPEENLKILITDGFLIELIDKIQDFSNENAYYYDFCVLSNFIEMSIKVSIKLLGKINELHSDFNLKTVDEIDSSVQFFNKCFKILNNNLSSNFIEIETLFNKIVLNKTIINPTNPTNKSYDTIENYIDQIINEPEKVENITILCKYIYTLTHNNVNIINVLNKLVANNENRTIINSHLVDLLNILSLDPLSSIILTDNTYSENSLKLLKYIFKQKIKDEYTISNEDLKSKLAEILNLIYIDDSRKKELMNFLEELIQDDRIKNNLIVLISGQPKMNILKLTAKLQTLAIDAILDGNIQLFSNNIEFLKVVASNGGPKHIQRLVKILKTKLPDESQFTDAISIIMDIKRISATDASRLRSEIDDYQLEDYTEDIISNALTHLTDISEVITVKKKKFKLFK